MEIVNNICYLTVGEKVKLIDNEEAGVILDVIDEDQSKVEFFDETLVVKAEMVKPLIQLSFQKYDKVQFYKGQKTTRRNRYASKKVIPIADYIDLHAEILLNNHQFMSSEHIIQKQLSHLYNYIERAIAQKMRKITIVHGVGTGSLRSQVIDTLENKYHLYDFEDSNLGLTIVYL